MEGGGGSSTPPLPFFLMKKELSESAVFLLQLYIILFFVFVFIVFYTHSYIQIRSFDRKRSITCIQKKNSEFRQGYSVYNSNK